MISLSILSVDLIHQFTYSAGWPYILSLSENARFMSSHVNTYHVSVLIIIYNDLHLNRDLSKLEEPGFGLIPLRQQVLMLFLFVLYAIKN